jgi:putative transposase
MLNVIDEFTGECLMIRIDRKLKSTDVIDVLSVPSILRGVPGHIRSDNGPEFIAQAVRQWIAAVGAKTAFIEPGSPWENGYCESFNSKVRDELLNGEIFYSLAEARVVIEGWRQHYNTIRPHPSLGYKPPAREVVLWPASTAIAEHAVAPDVAPKPTMHQKRDPGPPDGAGHAQPNRHDAAHVEKPSGFLPSPPSCSETADLSKAADCEGAAQ